MTIALMTNNTAAGSLSDVADAQRAARATITPWWLRFLSSAAIAVVMAGMVGPVWSRDLMFAIVAVMLLALIQRRRGVDVLMGMPRLPWPTRVVAGYVATAVVFAALWLAGTIIQVLWLTPGGGL